MNKITIIASIVIALFSVAKSQTPSPQQNDARRNRETILKYWLGNDIDGMKIKCGFPAIAHAMAHRNELPAATAAALLSVTTRPYTQKSVVRGKFRIHYDTTGIHEPALLDPDSSYRRIPGTSDRFVDSVGAVANHSLAVETDTSVGFLPPPPSNGIGADSLYDIYIQALGYYGETDPDIPIISKPDGGTYTAYMTIDCDFSFVYPDSNKGLPALRVTIAHELNHAIQIGNYGFWTSDQFFYEITSVWLEDVVYTGVNDYYQYLQSSQGHFHNPQVPFNSNAFIMYSRGIWGTYVAKKFGVHTMVRSWLYIPSYRPLEAIDNALQEQQSGLRQAFAEWTLWNYYTGSRSDPVRFYPEGANYPQMIEAAKGFTVPSRTVADSLQYLAARYYDIVGGQVPLKLITCNINLNAALSGNNSYFPFLYNLNTSRVDNSYVPTASRIYVKFDVSDALNWVDIIDTSAVSVSFPPPKDSPFPNPFRPNGANSVKIPINNFGATSGTLYIFSTSMARVYAAAKSSFYTSSLGQQVFDWNGFTDDGKLSPSGIYFYVLELPGQTLKGKIALIRK